MSLAGLPYVSLAAARLAVVVVILLSVEGASAQESARESPLSADEQRAYSATVEEAVQEFSQGNYSEARTMFHRAYEIDPNARVLRGLAGVEFELRNYVRCLEYIEASLVSERKPLTPAMRKDMQDLEARARGYVATATFKVSPEPVVVTVDGVERELPESGNLFLEVGKHEVVVRAPGHKSLRLPLDLIGGQPRLVEATLVPVGDTGDAQAAHDDSVSRRRRRWAWALSTVAVVVGAGVGLGVGLSRRSGDDSAAPTGGNSGLIVTLKD